MSFTSRRQKLLKLYLLIKDAESRNDIDSLHKYVPQLRGLRLNKIEIEEMELEKYFNK